MPYIPEVDVDEARGNLAPPAPIDQAAVIIGCSSAGTSGALSQTYSNAASLRSDYGEGPGVAAAECVIAQYGIPVRFYKTPSNPGTYETLDASGFTGTVAPTVGATTPLNEYEAYIIFKTGTTGIGTTGATYQESLDDGRTLSKTKSLGTGNTITIKLPNGTTSGVQIVLNSKVTGTADITAGALYGGGGTLAATSETLILTVGGVGPTTLTFDGTNAATEAAMLAALQTTFGVTAVAGGAGSNKLVITGPGPIVVGAGTANSALGLSAGTVAGTIVAGDIIRVRCHAPTCAMTDLDAAAALPGGALTVTTYEFSHVFVAQPLSATDAAHVTTLLNNLRTVDVLADAVIYTRGPDTSTNETEATWATSVEADYAAFNDDRIEIVEGMPTIVVDPVTAQVWHRSWAYAYFARMLNSERGVWPASPHDGGFTDPNSGQILVALYDANDVKIGHDEGPSGTVTGLGDAEGSGNRFTCLFRGPTQQTRTTAYTTVPWVAWTNGGRIFNMPQRRIALAMERRAKAVSFDALGDKEFYDTDPSTGISTLVPEKQDAIHHILFDALTGTEFQDDISNSADDDPVNGLVQVNPVATVSSGTVQIYATIAPKVEGLLVKIGLTYAAQ